MKSSRILFFLFMITACFRAFPVSAQETNYKVGAIYLYNFIKNIEWPSSKVCDKFVIGFYGNSKLIDELIILTENKNINGMPLEVYQLNSEWETQKCHIIFLPYNQTEKFNELVECSGKNNFLLVTERKNFARKGAGINLIIIDGKQKFELNETAIKNAGLKISSNLLALAILVH